MLTIGDRLREERERIGMNQTDFAALGGITKTSQVNYEANRRQPDAVYLSAIAADGADVGYILTGRPSGSVSVAESELLRLYRAAPLALRDAALRVLNAPGERTGSPSAEIAGDIGQVVQGDAIADQMTFHVGGSKKGKGR